jgi:TolA-binding protein
VNQQHTPPPRNTDTTLAANSGGTGVSPVSRSRATEAMMRIASAVSRSRAGRPCHQISLQSDTTPPNTNPCKAATSGRGPATSRFRRAFTLAALLASLALPSHFAAAQSAPTEDQALSAREQRLRDTQRSREDEQAEQVFRTAETTYLVGELERAVELYRSILTKSPNSSFVLRARARMADCAFESKQYDEAITLYRKAGDLVGTATVNEERDAAIRSAYMVGQTYLTQAQYPQAFAAFRKFIDQHGDHPLANYAYKGIGDGHLAMQQYQQALQSYRMVGTVLTEQDAGRKRIAPGARLYVRVNDADVNVSDVPRPIAVVIRTATGDVERVIVPPLGMRQPTFLTSVPTTLGNPRLSGAIADIYSDTIDAQIAAGLTEAARLRADGDKKRQEAFELERSARSGAGDPAGVEKARAAAAAEADQLVKAADAKQAATLQAVDKAYAAMETLLTGWSPDDALPAVRQRLKEQIDQPQAAPTISANAAQGPIALTGDGEDIDPLLRQGNASDETDVTLSTQSGGLTQTDIDRVRVDTADAATTLDTVTRRRLALSMWTQALLRQFQQIEIGGNDRITITYIDAIGPDGPYVGAEGQRIDTLEVASDARIAMLTADGNDLIQNAVLGSTIKLRVEDLDRDVTPNRDSVTAVLAVLPAVLTDTLATIKAEEAAQAKVDERGTPGLVSTNDAAEAVKEPLTPDNVPHATVTLTETGEHTGIFELNLALTETGATIGDTPLPMSPGTRLRLAYQDAKALTTEDGFVLATLVETVESRGGDALAVRFRDSRLDLEAKLQEAVAAGELGKIYLDLGLVARGRAYLAGAQRSCAEVAAAAPKSKLGEDALYHAFRIYFYADLLDDAVAAARLLMSRYPGSEYVDDAMLQIGKVSFERGSRTLADAMNRTQASEAQVDLRRAVGQFDQLVNQYPESELAPEALFYAGQAKIALGQTGLDSFERLAKSYPDSGFASRGLIRAADYYIGVGDYHRAQEYCNRVLIDYPDSPQLGRVLLHRGVCQAKLGQNGDALQSFYRVLEEHPGTDLSKTAQQYINFLNRRSGGEQ